MKENLRMICFGNPEFPCLPAGQQLSTDIVYEKGQHLGKAECDHLRGR